MSVRPPHLNLRMNVRKRKMASVQTEFFFEFDTGQTPSFSSGRQTDILSSSLLYFSLILSKSASSLSIFDTFSLFCPPVRSSVSAVRTAAVKSHSLFLPNDFIPSSISAHIAFSLSLSMITKISGTIRPPVAGFPLWTSRSGKSFFRISSRHASGEGECLTS